MAVLAKRESTIERRRALFEDAAAIIEQEYADDLALDEVAQRIATSRRQLQRAFAEAGETSFRTYLHAVRMREAAGLLTSGALPVGQVANAVGYRQPAQFAKAFRRHHGTSPSTYRAQPASAAA